MFGELAICYLFLGGTGAGLLFAVAVLGLILPRNNVAAACPGRWTQTTCMRLVPSLVYRELFTFSSLCALAMLLAGVLCLLLDLGSPDRIFLFIISPQLNYVVIGAWSLTACIFFSALLTAGWSGVVRLPLVLHTAVEIVSAVIAVVTMAYTGLLLQGMETVPLWSTPALPTLFVVSALSCGIMCFVLMLCVTDLSRYFKKIMRLLSKIDIALLAVECALVIALLLPGLLAGGDSPTDIAWAQSAELLLTGSVSWIFLGPFVSVGLIAPLVIEILLSADTRLPHRLFALAATLVLIGGFSLRYCMVEAAVHPITAVSGLL